jgi:hydroxyacylglutathione hydrolase
MKVHLVKTRYSNTYVIEDDQGLLVVDVAMRCDGFVLKFIVEELERSVRDVSLVVCTHDDPDHIGGIIPLARACHAESAIPHASKRSGLKFLRNPLGPAVKVATTAREVFSERARNMYMSNERKSRYEHVPNQHLDDEHSQRFILPKSRLKHGMRLPNFPDWEVIHTPGHSWDSVCFFHWPSRSLITGDTLLGSGQKGHLVQPAIYDNPMAMRKTVNLLKGLSPLVVYPGHGSVMRGESLLSHL